MRTRQFARLAVSRRQFMAGALMASVATSMRVNAQSERHAAALTKAERDALTPSQVIDDLRNGNERFRTGKTLPHDYREQQRTSAAAQYPAAVVLGCIDSRAPAEIIFDVGIGETFNARIAGNIVDDDLLGSLEFACAVAGAKAVVMFGHTACGAIKGAIDNVEMGNLTGLLTHIKPAVAETTFSGERSSKNNAYVDAVARTNVRLGIANMRSRSPVLAGLEKDGRIQIVGAMYDVSTGAVDFL